MSDVSHRQAGRRKRLRELLAGGHLEAAEGHVVDGRGLARIHEHQLVLVLDRPAVDRHRVAPLARQEEVQLPSRASPRIHERALQPRGAGGQGVDLHCAGPHSSRR